MAQGQLDSLDKVQQEINRVLELVGKVFLATKASNRAAALATATRLKYVLPLSTDNYHNALDELDGQLHYAKLVLRRDLAVATEKPDANLDAKPEAKADVKLDTKSDAESAAEPAIDTDVKSTDLAVTDTDPVTKEATELPTDSIATPKDEELVDVKSEVKDGSSSPVGETKPSTDHAEVKTSPSEDDANVAALEVSDAIHTTEAPQDIAARDQDGLQSTDADIDMPDSVDVKHDLKLDTTSNADHTKVSDGDDLDKEPDTAFSNNADMDSLFNDPTSADGPAPDTNATSNDNFDFGNEATNSNDFDFAAFSASLDANASNDNMNSLIPGLQDFTNGGADDAEPDFSALFGMTETQDTIIGDSQTQHTVQGGQHDFNFDDMMDFSINPADGTADQESNMNNDFEIDFSYLSLAYVVNPAAQ